MNGQYGTVVEYVLDIFVNPTRPYPSNLHRCFMARVRSVHVKSFRWMLVWGGGKSRHSETIDGLRCGDHEDLFDWIYRGDESCIDQILVVGMGCRVCGTFRCVWDIWSLPDAVGGLH